MNVIKAICFDCDGTIVDSENAHYRAWKHAMQRQGGDLSLEEYYTYVGSPTESIALRLSKRLERDCADEIFKDKCQYFFDLLLKGIPPIQPTLDFILRLAKKREDQGFKLGLASAAKKEEIILHLNHLGISELFDIIISGPDDLHEYQDPEGTNKPKPYIYLHAAKKLNIAASECIVIEDSCTGVRAGIDAGCFTIAIPNSYSRCQDFSLAHMRIETFAGIDVTQFLQKINLMRVGFP